MSPGSKSRRVVINDEGHIVRSECLTDRMLSDARHVVKEYHERGEVQDDVYYMSTAFRRSVGLGSDLNLIIPTISREYCYCLYFMRNDIERTTVITAEVHDLDEWKEKLGSRHFEMLNEGLLEAQNGQQSTCSVLVLERLNPDS